MIITCRRHVPFHCLIATAITVAGYWYFYCAVNNAFLFSLKNIWIIRPGSR